MSDWSPEEYLKFAEERTRPARDLLARVPLDGPRWVYDLGCGPGNSTALLAEAWPLARITGIDNSPAMLDAARKALPYAGFTEADLAIWQPEDQPELLFANATFQWLPDHLAVMRRLLRTLRKGGVLAVQMPDNLAEPSHRLMAEVAEQGPWRNKLKNAAAARAQLPEPLHYYAELRPLCAEVDIWHTIYNHPLQGAHGIVEWLKSTGLRPWLEPLNETESAAFLSIYETKLSEAYPALEDGAVLLRFPRLFIVAIA